MTSENCRTIILTVNLTSSVGSRGGSVYLGKDILGSVRSTSGEYGMLEERYEYDAFGKPYKGDLSNGMSLGYTGKPYDMTTGLYNYGYRDYKPEAARFTTVDPWGLWDETVKDAINNRREKTTVTIPRWLKEAAEAEGINYSRLLEIAVKETLGIGS
jgi:RHS repeat-associated protein